MLESDWARWPNNWGKTGTLGVIRKDHQSHEKTDRHCSTPEWGDIEDWYRIRTESGQENHPTAPIAARKMEKRILLLLKGTTAFCISLRHLA